MKTINLCLMSFLLLAGFTYCKKDNQFAKQNNIQLSEKDAKIEHQIFSFKERMVSPLKSNDSLSIDSTLWYIEITANYTYGDATAHNENGSLDSNFFTTPTKNEMISLDDINTTYLNIIDFIRQHYQSVEALEKHLLSVTVSMETVTASELTIKVISCVVSGPYTGYFTFEPWECWWYGMGLGRCDGSDHGKDAATEIARRIMSRKLVPTGYYYYDPHPSNPFYINANDYPISGIPPSNTFSHYMWWEDSNLPNFHLMLPSNELNFYLTGTEHVIYDIEKPLGNDFMNISYFEGTLQLGTTIWVHWGEINYGVLHQSTNPPEDL